jgi:RNA polymerase sigma-70 factor (family 1)
VSINRFAVPENYPTGHKELLLQIADGNETAFRELFRIYIPLLMPMILKVVKNENHAEDIIQDTFLKIWIHRDQLPEIENPRSWILRIAFNLAFSFLKRTTIHARAVLELAGNGTDLDSNSTENEIARRQLESMVKEAVASLPSQQKKVYLMSREGGLKTNEIAKQLDLSPQSVKNTMVRALKHIRDHIGKSGYPLLSILYTILYLNQVGTIILINRLLF